MKHFCTILFLLALSHISYGQFYYEDFENGIPDTWTAENAWVSGTAGTLSSQSFPILDHGRFVGVNDDELGSTFHSEGKLISPMMDLSSLDDSYAISFEAYFLNSDFQGKDETAKLLASTNGGQSWSELYDIEASFDWQVVNVALGSLAGQAEVWFAFEYDDDKGWNYGVAIDDVQIRQVYQRNASLVNYSVPKYVSNSEDLFIDYTVRNSGIETIESFDVKINHQGDEYTIPVGIPPIGYLEEFDLQVQVPFEFSETELYGFIVSLENINGKLDLDPSDNMGILGFSSVANPPVKVTVAEEGTGTWCGWCPRGTVALEYMKETYPSNFIGIAVHNGDPMSLAEYDDGLGVSSFPGLYIDRTLLIDPGETEAYHLENISKISPIGVNFSFEYDEVNREVIVRPVATIHTRLSGDYRFSIILSEDNITGTGGGYDQANYYSNAASLVDIHGVDWKDLPDPVPASQIVYNDVGRAIIGGFEGIPNSIGAQLNNGDEISTEMSFVIPNDFDEQNLSIAVIAIDAQTGEVLNGKRRHMYLLSGLAELPIELSNIDLFPNPANQYVNLSYELEDRADVQLKIYNHLGQLVDYEDFGSRIGAQEHKVETADLAIGSYVVSLVIDGWEIPNKIVVKR